MGIGQSDYMCQSTVSLHGHTKSIFECSGAKFIVLFFFHHRFLKENTILNSKMAPSHLNKNDIMELILTILRKSFKNITFYLIKI